MGALAAILTSTLTIGSAGSLTLGDGSSGTSTPLTVNSSGTLNVNGALTLAAASGQTANVPIAGTINLGGTGASGTLTLNGQNGATFDLGYGGGSGTLTMANSSQIVGSTGHRRVARRFRIDTLGHRYDKRRHADVTLAASWRRGGTLTIQARANANILRVGLLFDGGAFGLFNAGTHARLLPETRLTSI